MGFKHVHTKLLRVKWFDLFLVVFLCFFVYALLGVAGEWTGPFRSRTEIDLSLTALPQYAFFSLVRGFVAYSISLLFAIAYGYLAAHAKKWERLLIACLDVLQSIPVLGLMPGIVLLLVGVFPNSNIGLELASIIMIFNGQVWNMTFSFYSSVKTVPQEMREVGTLFRLGRFEVLRTLEIPYAMNGLLWNSMLSMAGGWFFLMVAESFTLGERSFRLPGMGAYMAVANERGDTGAIFLGVVTMFIIIILVDRCFWAPLVQWSERFRIDRVREYPESQSIILKLLKGSKLIRAYDSFSKKIKKNWLTKSWNQGTKAIHQLRNVKRMVLWLRWFGLLLFISVILFGTKSVYALISQTPPTEWFSHVRDTFFTLSRVIVAVIFGSLWTIPLGVWIGTHPKWLRRLQPVVQVVAAFPAPMLFPILTIILTRRGFSFDLVAIILMIMGSQWYILFNVISGASLIPQSMVDISKIFKVKGLEYWKAIILPSIFPALVDGWITAAGGAWNACIVSELVYYGTTAFKANGIGATITEAASNADFPRLAGAMVIMVTTLVILNRFFWRELYRLAETRFRVSEIS